MPEKDEEDEIEDASRSFKHSKARTAFVVAIIGAATTGVAAVVVPIVQSYIVNRPAVKANSEEVLKALKEQSEQQQKDIRQLREDLIDLRSWTKGYLMAQGYRVTDPPDKDLPPTPVVEIHPKPVHPKRSVFTPAPVVETPLPFPKELSPAKPIPYPVVPPQ